MSFAPEKVFVLENGEYIEISYGELCRFEKENDSYKNKWFLPLYGMLMEVSEDVYKEFYRNKRHEKYCCERAKAKNDFSYDMLTTDDFNGEDILTTQTDNIDDIVEHKILLEKLRKCLSQLTAEERGLITAIFFEGLSERKLSEVTGVPQKTINDRKHQILFKLRKLMEN